MAAFRFGSGSGSGCVLLPVAVRLRLGVHLWWAGSSGVAGVPWVLGSEGVPLVGSAGVPHLILKLALSGRGASAARPSFIPAAFGNTLPPYLVDV